MSIATKYPNGMVFFTENFAPNVENGAFVYPPITINHGGQKFNVPSTLDWCGGQLQATINEELIVPHDELPNKNGDIEVLGKHLRFAQIKAHASNTEDILINAESLVAEGSLLLAAGESLFFQCESSDRPVLGNELIRFSADVGAAPKISYMLHGDA